MATISSLGIGSGLDSNSIVNQLMELERQPILALQQKEAGYYAELTALGQLRSATATFKSAASGLSSDASFASYSATSADTAKFTASASGSAVSGSYNIEVTTLAQAHKLKSDPLADADVTSVGTTGDTMEITIGSDSFSVEIGGKSLNSIATAINEASDNVGVTASVLQEDADNFSLVLASNNSGLDNKMTLAFEDSLGATIDPYTPLGVAGMSEIQEALDAVFKVDNVTLTRSSNTVSDAIQGVTLNLLDSTTGAVQLDVNVDTNAIVDKVQSFVDGYNELQGTLTSLGEGGLAGDSALRLLDSQVRSVLNSPPLGLDSTYSTLSDIGVEFQKDGTLTLNKTTLSSAIRLDLDAVTDLFANDDQGYAFRMDSLLSGMLGADGLIDAREDGIDARIGTTQQQIEDALERLEVTETRLRAKFTTLDLLVADMQSTSTYLSGQLEMLSNLTVSSNK